MLMEIRYPDEEQKNVIQKISNDMSFLDGKFVAYEMFDIPLSNPINIDSLSEDEYYILYFDILGYKEKIKQYGEEYFLKVICAVIDTIDTAYEDSEKGRNFGYHIFSDNIIVFSKKESNTETNVYKLIDFIKDAYIIQRNLMGQYRILLRGAITEGKLYYGGNFIYGTGLIDSYLMEDEKAINPRIIISKNLINKLNSVITDDFIFKYAYRSIKQIINIDIDGEYFVGYINKFGNTPQIFVGYLYYHKNLIESYFALGLKEKEKSKIIWCKEYHNTVCSIYELDNLKIY